MAKGIVKARANQAPEEFALRVIYSETEPSRNYIWGHPNGGFYVWNGCKWALMELPESNCEPKNCGCNCKCDCITREELEVRLENFKKEVLSAFIRLQNSKCDGTDALEDWIEDEISRIDAEIINLKNKDVLIDGTISNLDNDTDRRLDLLESHDSTDCVTAEDIPVPTVS